MYNTKVDVKYKNIENELLNKINNKMEDYSSEDVLNICDELYRTELLKVFGAENIESTKLDDGYKYVFSIMEQNESFKQCMNEIASFLNNKLFEYTEKSYDFIFTLLFSNQLFHITHKCVCQQIETGVIDECLLNLLKPESIKLLQEKFF